MEILRDSLVANLVHPTDDESTWRPDYKISRFQPNTQEAPRLSFGEIKPSSCPNDVKKKKM
jgi:hypothetical protein